MPREVAPAWLRDQPATEPAPRTWPAHALPAAARERRGRRDLRHRARDGHLRARRSERLALQPRGAAALHGARGRRAFCAGGRGGVRRVAPRASNSRATPSRARTRTISIRSRTSPCRPSASRRSCAARFATSRASWAAAPVARVILAGEITELIDLSSGLSEHLGLPVEVLAESSEGDQKGRPVGGAAVVLGMACAPDRRGGDLLAAPVQRGIADRRMRTYLLRALAVCDAVGRRGRLSQRHCRPGRCVIAWSSSTRCGAPQRPCARVSRQNRQSSERARAHRGGARGTRRADAEPRGPASTTLAHEMPDEAALERLGPRAGRRRLRSHADRRGRRRDDGARGAGGLRVSARDLAAAPFVRIDRVEREASVRRTGAAGRRRADAVSASRAGSPSIEACASGGAP